MAPPRSPASICQQRGFGKLWRENKAVRECVGYASTPNEVGFTMTLQRFQGGVLFLSDTPEGRFVYSAKIRRNCHACGNTITYERYPLPAR